MTGPGGRPAAGDRHVRQGGPPRLRLAAAGLAARTLALLLAGAAPAAAQPAAPAGPGIAACHEASPPLVRDGRVVASPLTGLVQGHAAGTTGGLGHRLLLVRSVADAREHPRQPAPAETLRGALAIAAQEGGGWIRFDPALAGQTIRLAAVLQPGPNTTIDGGCTGIRLIAEARVSLLRIAVANVIVSGLSLQKDPYQDAEDRTGDAISLSAGFDRVAVLHNAFRRCGDGCVDAVRRDRMAQPGRVTIAFNRFEDHNKVMLIGTLVCSIPPKPAECSPGAARPGGGPPPEILVTLLANLFERTSQRNPKVVSGALVDMVNNLVVLGSLPYPDGRRSALYGAIATGRGMLIARGNIFASIDPQPAAGPPRLAVGPGAALSSARELPDGPGIVRIAGNIALDGLRAEASPPAAALEDLAAADTAPVAALAVTPANLQHVIACLRRVAGPAGLGQDWPAVCA